MKIKFKRFNNFEIVIIILCSIIFFISFIWLIGFYVGGWVHHIKMGKLGSSMVVEEVIEALEEPTISLKELDSYKDFNLQNDLITNKELDAQKEITSIRELELLPQFTKLYQENQDIIGWLSIEGTKVDYPIMYTPNNPEYYIHKNFVKEYEKRGLPFLDGNTEIKDSKNYIIYGHNMGDGTGFKDILKYENEDFYKEHPRIRFDTLYELGEYEVVAAFYSKIYYDDEDVFKYYKYINILDDTSFDEYQKNIKALSLYDTNITLRQSDKLITLSTCSYHIKEGRFVVVAKKI